MRLLLLVGVLLQAVYPIQAQTDILPTAPIQNSKQIAESDDWDFIPSNLQAWVPWVLWRQADRGCAPDARDFSRKFCQWPSQLEMQIGASGGSFQMQITTLCAGWVFLPGRSDLWPQDVKVSGNLHAVLPRRNETMRGRDSLHPAVYLRAGNHIITGKFSWKEMPVNLNIPKQTGILRLSVGGEARPDATWDAGGLLWLRGEHMASEQVEADFISFTQTARLRDGIPMWFDSELEFIVTGRSREEILGSVVPTGWQLAQIEGPLPAIMDAEGSLRVQVRAGKWKLRIAAFRLDPTAILEFTKNETPASREVFIALQTDRDLRLIEFCDVPLVDPSQITFPAEWSNLPVYRWNTDTPLRIEEILRGRGVAQSPPLEINRRWWLGQDGASLTTLDTISGQEQELWRLDAAPVLKPGSVRLGEAGQLLTKNPLTGADGFEIRQRNFSYIAAGTMTAKGELPASGWDADAENVRVNLNLPPGWRAFAVWGPDWVNGEWLSSWSLLDLFLLLIFALAVHKLFGVGAAALAFVAFVLFCHEPGAPKFTWLLLLIPIALIRVVPHAKARRVFVATKWILAAILVLFSIPFFSQQIQQAIFPQLERTYGEELVFSEFAESQPSTSLAEPALDFALSAPAGVAEPMTRAGEEITNELDKEWAGRSSTRAGTAAQVVNQNLLYESKARIQTGPGIPDWQWQTVNFGWNGPVSPSQTVELWLVSEPLQRGLTVLRLALILLLAGVLLRRERGVNNDPPSTKDRHSVTSPPPLPVTLLVAAAGFLFLGNANAQFPDAALLQELRERLLAAPEVFPNAASISEATLSIEDDRLLLEAEVHTAARCAVPVPAKLSAWSPVSVSIGDRPAPALLRADESLWVLLEPGIHKIRVEGHLHRVSEWQWSFLLRPHRVAVNAPGWSVGGINSEGIPEGQVFLVREEKRERAASAYERPELAAVAKVEREIELGLVWQVRTTVRRLSLPGRAVSFELPLLPGEKVLDPNAVVQNGRIQVRLGSQQEEIRWTSELGILPELELATPEDATWVEEWRVLASPVWNLEYEDLVPIYSEKTEMLLPTWRPWPGESVKLNISRPQALEGDTVTVHRVGQEIEAGQRLLSGTLELGIRASMGEEFALRLPEKIEVTTLSVDGNPQPVRQADGKIAVSLRPGEQNISLNWRLPAELTTKIRVPEFLLPVAASNIHIVLRLPEDRWILWTQGPVRGPAVRFWIVLAAALLAAGILSRMPHSPIGFFSWALLGIGLTQVPYGVALVVVAWLFLLVWRGRPTALNLPQSAFNLLQLALPVLTLGVLSIFLGVVAAGLLGDPRMFIIGNGSSAHALQWFAPSADSTLPTPAAWAVSDGWYRVLMLAWALWLAVALLRWLRWGWQQYGAGGYWKKCEPKVKDITK